MRKRVMMPRSLTGAGLGHFSPLKKVKITHEQGKF